MSRLLKSRARLLRVRHVQHMLAVGEAMAARDQANQIESNARRLARVREELFAGEGVANGAHLAAQRELAERLERAGRQLDGALYDARRRVDEKQAQVISADREREIAERLKDKAHRAAEDKAEARLAAIPLYRKIASREENGS